MKLAPRRSSAEFGIANDKMTKRLIVIVCGTVLLIAAAVVVAIRERQPALPMPEAPVAQTPAEMRVKAVERMGETLDFSNAEAPLAMLAHNHHPQAAEILV